MLPANIKEKIISTYNINKGDVELEARFGLFKKNTFKPGVTRSIFNRIKSYFDARAAPKITESTDYIMGNVRKSVIDTEDEESNEIIWITKNRLWNVPLKEFGIRYSMSSEIPIDPIAENLFNPTFIRRKKRSSYLVFGNAVQIDITLVTSVFENRETVTYEVEIELLNRTKLSSFEKAIEVTQRLVLDTVVLYTESMRMKTVDEINSILGSNKRGYLDHYPLVQARNLKMRDMVFGGLIGNEKTGYSVTHKADGQRKMLVFLDSGIWLASTTLTRVTDKEIKHLTGTILDGEMIPEDKRLEGAPKQKFWYLAFDALASNRDKYIQKKPHGQRMFYAQTVSDAVKGNLITVNTKTFKNISTPQEFFKLMREMYREQLLLSYQQDGFMFTPQNTEYNPHSDTNPLFRRSLVAYPDVCKWKPKDELTIDFLIRWEADANSPIKRRLELYSNVKGSPVKFTKGEPDLLNPLTLNLPDDTIVEYAYDYEKELLIPTRVRHDKEKPNKMDIADDVWSDIMMPLDEETMKGNTLTLLRRYHNRIKRDLFTKSMPDQDKTYLLDIGSGRGGDIYKWKVFDKIVAVEPNPEHIKELERRLEESKIRDRVYILQAGGEETEKIKAAVDEWIGGRVDVVSSMLSLTFFWQKSELVDALVETILVNIKPKGKFIFLTMDGDLAEQTFEPKFETGLVLKKLEFNNIATLEYFGDKNPKEIKIHIEDSIVTDQTEWLVRLNDLLVRTEKYGFKFTLMQKADEEKFLTEDEIIMTQMYTYGMLKQTEDMELPDIKVSEVVELPIKSELPVSKLPPLPVSKLSVSKLPPLKSPKKSSKKSPKKSSKKSPKKSPKKSEKQLDEIRMDEVEKVKLTWWDENVVRIGSISDGNCFIHSVLNSYLKIYQTNSNIKFRKEFAKNFRRDISHTLRLPDPEQPDKIRYETAANGQFLNLYAEQLQGLDFEDVFDQKVDFSIDGLEKLFDSNDYLGDEIYSYIADILDVNIYVMRLTSKDLYVHLDTGPGKKSIVISGNGYHFETIGVERNELYQTFFEPDDPFILKIRSFSS